MTKLCVYSSAISLDGYGAGPDQSLNNPLGVGGIALHEWAFATRTFREMFGTEGGSIGIDDHMAARGSPTSAPGSWAATCSVPFAGPGPTRLGRADGVTTCPTRCPVFVLTHHAREPITMKGGTTFYSSPTASMPR